MIDNCLYKINRETPRTKGIEQRVNAVHELRLIHTRLEYEGFIQSLKVSTTRVVQDKTFICI